MPTQRVSDTEAPPREDESRLLAALRGGDEEAFARIVEGYHPLMLHVARMHVSTRASAEEVVQEAWMKALAGLAGFRGRSSFKTWLFRILTNTAKDRGLRESRTVPLSSLEEPGDERSVAADRFLDPDRPRWWSQPPRNWAGLPVERLLDQETREVVIRAIESLPARQRVAIQLRDVEGWSSREICQALEISAGTERILVHRARAKVRTELERYLDEGGR